MCLSLRNRDCKRNMLQVLLVFPNLDLKVRCLVAFPRYVYEIGRFVVTAQTTHSSRCWVTLKSLPNKSTRNMTTFAITCRTRRLIKEIYTVVGQMRTFCVARVRTSGLDELTVRVHLLSHLGAGVNNIMCHAWWRGVAVCFGATICKKSSECFHLCCEM